MHLADIRVALLMVPFQVQLEAALLTFPRIAALLETAWGWPITESVHFVGLTLLFGCIAAWDLRLLGVATQVPIAAFHKLIPFALAGFAINAISGTFFLMTAPDQYVYNSAFHLKMLCVLLAGVNAAVFYTGRWPARVSGLVSIVLWVTVIVAGRMITFYRPDRCPGDAVLGFIANCIVR